MSNPICEAERKSSCRDGPKLAMYSSTPTVRFANRTRMDMYYVSTARFAGSEFDGIAVRATAARGSGMCHEVYSVIADAKGHIVREDTLVQRAGTELGCLELASSHLVPAMGLSKLPQKELTEDKKRLLREIRAKEPPSGSERAAMNERQKALRQAGASARLLVYPARVGGEDADSACARHLCKLLNEMSLCRATAAETAPAIVGRGWPNEMHVLWLFARNVREYVREHPVDSDYVLFADYWFNPRGQVWAVHFVVCDRAGDWAIVDLQNSHHEDFQRVDPKNREDCDRLVLERLKRELR